jgi:DNA repair protein RecN (Recombination protein N)
MLSRIAVRDLVIVPSLDLDLGPGLTALTGETGAGKSILIEALGLALGDKADSGLIRDGADRAEVTVAFDLDPESPARAWLDARDLALDGDCILRRVLVREGRSRAYINGSPVPLALLRELGERLVDIHGQHAHQALLAPAAQRRLLDAYAGLGPTVQAVGEVHRAWREAQGTLDALRAAAAERASRLDYLAFQIAELDSIACEPDQLREMEAEQARLAHAGRLLQDSTQVLAMLGEDEPSVQHALDQAVQTLTELTRLDPGLLDVRELLEGTAIQLDEALRALRHYQDRVELDPDRLHEVDTRLGRLYDAARKHRVHPAELGSLLAGLQDEAAQLENADARLLELQRDAQALETAYLDLARELSAARSRAAAELGATVTAGMQQLGMRGGVFEVACEADTERPGAHGLDRVMFRVAANPGQAVAALADVASGGELSRISLAIQVATARCGSVPCLVFDEVDVGIGGAVAEIVGKLLRRLGKERQVLCVTHLPQVAAQAHHQLRVQKFSDGQSTETRIEALDDDTRIDEIARMLGGIAVTEQALLHAREMIGRAQD